MRSTRVVTRKEHRCFTCERKFPAGTEMINWCSIYEGEFCSGYNCMTCEEILKHWSDTEFVSGCVNEALDKGQTPEGLLSNLIESKCQHFLDQISTSGTQT